MEVYGLTGGIGSGKSTVAAMLEEYGIPVVTADELSRMVVAPGSAGLADVVEAFGTEVLDDRGELDRKKMGRIVFTTPERRRQLEAILHPRIRERYETVLDALEKAGHPVMVYEVPLLFEKKLDQQEELTAVILVTATADTRIARIKERDSLTTEDVLARMRAQMPEPEKRARANYVIHNDGNLDDLRREVEYLLSRFLRLPPRPEPLSEDSLEEIVEIEEFEAVLDEIEESEVDTLSPEEIIDEVDEVDEVDEEDSEETMAMSATPDPHDVADSEMTMPSTNVPSAPSARATSREMPATYRHVQPAPPVIPAPIPAPIPATSAPAQASKPQLEVELHPPTSSRSGSTWIPAPAQPAEPSTPDRPRRSTAPQLEVPELAKPAKPNIDEQEPST